MKLFFRNMLAVAAVFLLSATASAQYHEYAQQSGIGIPFFQLAVHRTFSADLKHSHLKITAQFLYDDLTFLRSDTSGYDAEFEILFAVYDEHNQVVASHTTNKKINVKDFENTNSRSLSVTLKDAFDLEPGAYKLLARAVDLNSTKNAQRKVELKIPDYSGKQVAVSDLLFAKDLKTDSLGQLTDIMPTFGNNFNIRSGYFYVYFDLFVKQPPTEAHIEYILTNKKEKKSFDSTIVRQITKRLTPVWIKISRQRFRSNKYTLRVRVNTAAGKLQQEQPLSFFWSIVPRTDEDIDMALKQMSYILESDTLEKYEKSSLKEKQAFFKRFWKERDPDPTTSRNELKNEYFKRVNYANHHFSAMGQDGWRTDRGRILIKFGFPDDIERHPFEMGSRPYEIWRYYALRKVFVFEDVSGFGDYRLVPGYLDEEFN